MTDHGGRFVGGLRAGDFEIYENGKLQAITQFDAERVPVSLGIALDTSGSMQGEKMSAARAALSRFVYDLLGRDDEMFLYRFDSQPELVQGWTENRATLMLASMASGREAALRCMTPWRRRCRWRRRAAGRRRRSSSSPTATQALNSSTRLSDASG